MAVAFSSVAHTASGTGNSFTISITPPGTNPVILVGISLDSASATISSVSWSLGSGTPVEVKTARIGNSFASVWAIPAPTVGAGTITVNLSASVNYQAGAETFSGAHQTTPCPGADAVSATGHAQAALTLTPANLTANDCSFGVGTNTIGDTPTGFSQNDRFKDVNTSVNIQIGDSSGTAALTANWIPDIGDDAGVGVRIVVASVSSPAPPEEDFYLPPAPYSGYVTVSVW